MKHLPAVIIVGVVSTFTVAIRGADLLLAAFSADTIYKYDGVSATVFATDPGMNGPTAMVFNAAGNLLVLNEFSGNVLEFHGTSGAFLGTFLPSSSIGGNGILDPGDMEMGDDGHLYIMSHHNDGGNMIHKFHGVTGAYMGVFAGPGPIRHQHGMSFGPGGHLYQGNVDSGLVETFDGTTGAAMGVLTTMSVGPIADLTFGPGNLFVSTSASSGVARYDSTTGTFLGYLATTPGGPYWGLLVDSGVLYASNTTTGALKRFDSTTGAHLGDIALGGGAFDILAMPIPEPGALSLTCGAMVARIARRRRCTASISLPYPRS